MSMNIKIMSADSIYAGVGKGEGESDGGRRVATVGGGGKSMSIVELSSRPSTG